jgi:MFS transporter, MCT family, solute carrier family 16 (monocarboxylic acid transporters), member 3
MATTQTEDIQLTTYPTGTNITAFNYGDNTLDNSVSIPDSTFEAIPDGGYGWTVVFACSVVTFMINGWSGSWGVLQTALFQTYPNYGSTSTLSFVGSLSIALCVALGLASVRLSQLIGARYSMLLGVFMMSCGSIFSSFTVNNVGGLFVTAGVSFGLGSSLTFAMCNILPIQWFNTKLGTANGLVKLGGGLGATIMAVAIQALIDKVGIPWTFRILGVLSLASGIPAALLVRERTPPHRAPFADLSLFKSIPFCGLFLAGAIGTFALFVPPFFLPLFAHSIGLSASTGAGVVAGFNACTAIGRFGAGFACDKFGSTNMLLLTMALNAVSMLAIWPVSDTIGPLVIFAALNGVANGAFFVAMPTAIGRMIGPGKAAVGMGMAITGWTAGYLMGSPIAGILIAATGAETAQSVVPYRSAIFYAGGVALASATFVLVARLRMDKKLIKKM